MRKFRVMGILLLGLVLVLGACAPGAPAPAKTPSTAPAASPAPAPVKAPAVSEWGKVLEGAKKEGSLTIYNVLGNELGAALKEGMKQYGVAVETVGGNGGELELRIKTEQGAKTPVADIFISGWTNNMNLVKGGFTQPVSVTLPSLAEKDVWKTRPDQYEPTKSAFTYATAITPSVIMNTDLVKKGEITSWNDLLDSKWKDKMAMSDPRTGSGPGAAGMGAWQILGEEFWKKMAAQRITLQAKYELPVQAVAFGEKAVTLLPAYPQTVTAMKAGAPIQVVHLKEGTSYYVNGVAFVKSAPHPNAALVLLNWMFSKEGQAAVGRAAETYIVRKDVTEDWFKIAELRPGTFTFLDPPNNLDPENAKKGSAFAKGVFGTQ